LMKHYKVDAIPLAHEKINEWRDALRGGITFRVDGSNVVVTGGVDDVWVDPDGQLMVVDYKATAKDGEVSLDAEWQDGYKRQMEFYQWLLRQNGFDVSDTGYFVYVNGKTDRAAFDGKLEFDVKLISYKGSDAWIEEALLKIKKTLESDSIPPSGEDCDYCRYIEAANETDAYTN